MVECTTAFSVGCGGSVVIITPSFDDESHKEYNSKERDNPQNDEDNDSQALSVFGTKAYWDDIYAGRGDFPAEEYSWYCGWETLEPWVRQYIPRSMTMSKNNNQAGKDGGVNDASTSTPREEDETQNHRRVQAVPHLFIPGIGNDTLLIHLLRNGYRQVTVQDYSIHALERQKDLLSYEKSSLMERVHLVHGNVRCLPDHWTETFDATIEKGLLDAVYLSGGTHLAEAIHELHRVLKPGGILVSVSGVVPTDLRRDLFSLEKWKWLRDGTNDMAAGCFVLSKIGQR